MGTCPVRESKMVGIKNDEPAEKICCAIHSGSCSELKRQLQRIIGSVAATCRVSVLRRRLCVLHQVRVVVWCSVLQCTAVYDSALQRVAACYSALQDATVCYSVLQCVAVCCSVLQRDLNKIADPARRVRVALCCSVAAVCVAVRPERDGGSRA